MPEKINEKARRHRLGRRHLLIASERTDDVAAISDAVVALHSSDPVSVYLSVLARMRNPSLAAVDEALYERRTVVRHHAMRRTLWVATPPTVRAMHAACTRKIAAAEHRRTAGMLRDNGIEQAEAWLRRAKADVTATLAAHGPMTARDMGHRVPHLAHPLVLAPGKKYAATQAAHTRVLAGLGFDGVLVRGRPTGSWINGQYTWALMDDWLPGGLGEQDQREASSALALSWLRRFGPGTTTDLQWWAGWTLGWTRQALADCGADQVDLGGSIGWVAPGDHADAGDDNPDVEPWVALLPGLDPTVMGWKERSFYLPASGAPAWDRNGNAGPTIWVDGRVVGAWGQADDGTIRLRWFEDVPADRRRQVHDRAQEVRQWLGGSRFSVRFPGAINAELLA